MASEVEMGLAFVARREGRRSMPASRWAMVLSLDLGWMPPAAAHAFVARGIEAALLRPDGDDLRLAVDPATVEIPRGFRPGAQPAAVAAQAHRVTSAGPSSVGAPAAAASGGGPAVAAASPAPVVDPFLDWVDRLATHNRIERRQVLEQVNAVQEQMGGHLSAIAALLWLASRAGLDVRAAARAVRV